MSVAVIGPTTFTTTFKLIGAEAHNANDADQTNRVLKEIIGEKRHTLVIIPERYAVETRQTREEALKTGSITPVFALVPDFTMETGDRMQELQTVISLAIGTKLEL